MGAGFTDEFETANVNRRPFLRLRAHCREGRQEDVRLGEEPFANEVTIRVCGVPAEGEAWPMAVAAAALGAIETLDRGFPLVGWLEVQVTFYLPGARLLREYPSRLPDISRLTGATVSALEGARIWSEDASVVGIAAIKENALGFTPGAVIRLRELTPSARVKRHETARGPVRPPLARSAYA
jgi:Holliday junction resolvase RusA-like endonuclease